jgi:hypothetical protein
MQRLCISHLLSLIVGSGSGERIIYDSFQAICDLNGFCRRYPITCIKSKYFSFLESLARIRHRISLGFLRGFLGLFRAT